MTLALVLVLIASLLAAMSDLRTRRIPNALVGALLLGGLALNAFAGWRSVGVDVLMVAAVLAVGTLAFSFKLLGGGDVKLLAAATGTLGYPVGALFLLFTLLCGGVIGLAYVAIRGRFRSTLSNLQAIALPVFAGVTPAPPQGATPMPYALAIFAGALCTALFHGLTLYGRLLP